MRLLVQLHPSAAARQAAASAQAAPELASAIRERARSVALDDDWPVVQLAAASPATGGRFLSLAQPLRFSMEPQDSTYLARGRVDDGPARDEALAALAGHPEVAGVFADPRIESCLTCGDSPPVGDAAAVARRLGVADLAARGLDGRGVAVAVVDTGINGAYLAAHGRKMALDAARSWTPRGVSTSPGAHPVNHGTMCAWDVGIAAPRATLLDLAVLLSRTPGQTQMSGLLSDAVLAYARLREVLQRMPDRSRALVISNSWGMFSPTWDFPPGHPGNYSDNPSHPFNLMVASLEAAGADILFAAGNCGRECPDGRCGFGSGHPICGANSSPSVLSVAGVDVHRKRVGYSSQGPGRLSAQKPDVAGYTHFAGSGVYPEDSGTSAACPVVAGAVAALRTAHPASELAPAQLRALVAKTAKDVGGHGFDFDTGWGIVEPLAVARALGDAASPRAPGKVARAGGRPAKRAAGRGKKPGKRAARPGKRRRG